MDGGSGGDATSSERHRCQVGQNSKQEGLTARAPSDAVNYANELIRESERADKTKTDPL